MQRNIVAAFAIGLIASLNACSCGQQKAVRSPRALGQPCTQNADCLSALCGSVPDVDAGAGVAEVCVLSCNSTHLCPANDVCVDINKQTDGSENYACAPLTNTLCSPCTADTMCGYPENACLAFGDALDGGAYTACGQSCAGDGTCPDGWTCTGTAFRADGTAVSKQCVPVSGTCACTDVNRGMTRSCQNQNAYGTCLGVETCDPSTQGGFGNCNALTPEPNTCYTVEDHCALVTQQANQTCGAGDCTTTVPLCAPDGGKVTCVPACSCDAPHLDCDHDGGSCVDPGSDPNNCGGCGVVCSFANANSTCVDGGCVMLCKPGYADCDHKTTDGCEIDTNTNANDCGGCGEVCSTNHDTATCVGGNCQITCLTGFGDCDLDAGDGCETGTSSTTSNCGACGNVCSTNNDSATCVQGNCNITCDFGSADCDHDAGNGCETDTNTSTANCGSCGNDCASMSAMNATGVCTGGACAFTCTGGYVTTPGSLVPCNCHATSTSDEPDVPGFTDTNCDGIDGNISHAVFVDEITGNDANNDGGIAWPLKTVTAGINLASAVGKTEVYLSKGTYSSPTPVQLVNNVSLFGGYDAANSWSRASVNVTTLSGSVNPVQCNTQSDIQLQLLSVFGAAASATGEIATAVQLTSCQDITLSYVSIQSGDGAPGSDGTQGGGGANGGAGQDGQAGIEDDGDIENGHYFACDNCGSTVSGGSATCDAPLGGPAGTNSSCASANGGVGGNAGWDGATGAHGGASVGGVAGGVGVVSGQGESVAPTASNGVNGAIGATPSDGVGGASLGTLSVAGYTPADGSQGSQGSPGKGGGGGGGGGGGSNDCLSWGGGGGGGGAAGCGGQPGTPGKGGGASIALLMESSQVTANNCSFKSGRGGKGGNGGAGGLGGQGGGGGGSPYGGSSTQDDGSQGGVGGAGGPGGPGSQGGGGGGGPSIAIATFSSDLSDDAATESATLPGTGGDPGTGGSAAAGQSIRHFDM